MAAQNHANKLSTTSQTFTLAKVPGELDTLQKEGRPDLARKL
jgi:hypothetical protein